MPKRAQVELFFVAGDYENSGYISVGTGDRTYFYYHDLEKIKKEFEMHSLTITNIIEKEYQKLDDTLETHTIINAKKTNVQQ